MKNLIIESGKSNSGAEDIITSLGKLGNCVKNSCDPLIIKDKLEYAQLNDGFVIVCDFDYINELCKILCEIQWKVLIEIKLPIRGALTAGQVIIQPEPKVIIGPAFIKALVMEGENAIFPRVLFSEEIYQYIKKEEINFPYLTEDADHLKYIDYLKYEFDLEDNFRNFDNKLKVHGIKRILKKYYTDNIVKNKNIAQKYGWIIKKLSAFNIKIINEGDKKWLM
jgi:hypothetical protein